MTLLCREILAVNPFTGTKKGSPQRGQKWRSIAQNLLAVKVPRFTFTPWKGVKERYNLVADKLRAKLQRELTASGLSTEMTGVEKALEELIEKQDAADSEDAVSARKRSEIEKDTTTAEDMRQKAMERMGQTAKRKGDNEGDGKKKRRSNGSDTVVYLREKNESLEKTKKEEIDMRRQEIALQSKKHDDLMKILVTQQQQQAKAQQDFQNLMLTVLSRLPQPK